MHSNLVPCFVGNTLHLPHCCCGEGELVGGVTWTVGLGRLAVCIQNTVFRAAVFLWNAQWLLQSDLIAYKTEILPSCNCKCCTVSGAAWRASTKDANYNWINQLSNTTIWWLDICCLLHTIVPMHPHHPPYSTHTRSRTPIQPQPPLHHTQDACQSIAAHKFVVNLST